MRAQTIHQRIALRLGSLADHIPDASANASQPQQPEACPISAIALSTKMRTRMRPA